MLRCIPGSKHRWLLRWRCPKWWGTDPKSDPWSNIGILPGFLSSCHNTTCDNDDIHVLYIWLLYTVVTFEYTFLFASLPHIWRMWAKTPIQMHFSFLHLENIFFNPTPNPKYSLQKQLPFPTLLQKVLPLKTSKWTLSHLLMLRTSPGCSRSMLWQVRP